MKAINIAHNPNYYLSEYQECISSPLQANLHVAVDYEGVIEEVNRQKNLNQKKFIKKKKSVLYNWKETVSADSACAQYMEQTYGRSRIGGTYFTITDAEKKHSQKTKSYLYSYIFIYIRLYSYGLYI